jgi:spore germination cell wall hydrolase CwlJ-like protein
MVYQPHAFEATIKGYFYQRARESERRLARRAINGERLWPAKYSLWYFRPEGDCPLLGMISHTQDVLNCIAFMNRQVKSVQMYIVPFKVCLYNVS